MAQVKSKQVKSKQVFGCRRAHGMATLARVHLNSDLTDWLRFTWNSRALPASAPDTDNVHTVRWQTLVRLPSRWTRWGSSRRRSNREGVSSELQQGPSPWKMARELTRRNK